MTDNDLKQHVENALGWEPSVDATDIGVSTHDGVVTLRGTVRTYSEKVAAERAALRVFGAKAVANDLAIHLASGSQRTDTEIAHAALSALKWNTAIPDDGITLTVKNSQVTLNGTVDWQYQKDAAGRAVRDLIGVTAVINLIGLRPGVKAADVRDKIEAALKRSAEVDARRINVTATDGKVILTGNVHSWAERREVERAAWAAPGVMKVEDHLAIVP